MNKNIGKVIVYEESNKPTIKEINVNDLKTLQNIIGGYIETVKFNENLVIICDEEGVLKNRPIIKSINGFEFAGTTMIVGTNYDTGNFVGLTEQQLKKYLN